MRTTADVRLRQVRAQQPHAAVDVEADAARRDDRARVVHVERGDVADREAVARVDVGQPDRRAHDARQRGDVRELLHRGQEAAVPRRLGLVAQLVEQQRLERNLPRTNQL